MNETESAEVAELLELMNLADDLELPQEGVLELVRQYSMSEVLSILRTLSGQREAGKAFKKAFFAPKEVTEKPVRFWR